MFVLVAAQNLVTLFLGLELLSIPLYVLCATEMRRATSLESGLKYLIIGSVGSATLLYGLAFIYGATGSTDYVTIGERVGDVVSDPLLLTGIALTLVGMGFKASVAPFHQWTPDVYEGAPTPVTAFMAVATKAAAFGVFLRFFDVALIDAQVDWGPALAALATITIIVGNVGALGQSSLKRLMAWSSVAQAGYMLAGVVVGTRARRAGDGLLPGRLHVHEPRRVRRDRRPRARDAPGRRHPLGDRPGRRAAAAGRRMTLAMLGLAGIPATAGFIGKFYLIDAAVDGGYTWLGIVIVIGSMISLAYYLRVIAAMWMQAPEPAVAVAAGTGQPVLAGGAADADAPRAQPEAWLVGARVRRGDAVLRHHPLAAVRPGGAGGRGVDEPGVGLGARAGRDQPASRGGESLERRARANPRMPHAVGLPLARHRRARAAGYRMASSIALGRHPSAAG